MSANPELAIVPNIHKQEIAIAVDRVKILAEIVRTLKDTALTVDLDYGVIPNTGNKPTLLLPGMEKFMRALNAVPDYIERRVIVDYDRPLFHYEYECRLVDAETGLAIPGGRGLGLCTSYESSFRWRKAERVCPVCGKPAIIKGRDDYGGGWLCYARKGGCGAKFKDGDEKIEKQEVGRIENPDIFDQVNAIMKRAKKRALGDAIKGAANVSEFFTVDLEDLPHHEFADPDIVEGTVIELTQAEPPAPATPKQATTRKEANRVNTGANDKANGWPPAQETAPSNGDAPKVNVNNKVPLIRERTSYLYPDVKFAGHHNKSILALIAEGKITPDSSDEHDDIALLERRALKDHKIDHDDLMILLSGHGALVEDWGDWIGQGKTLPDAWAIVQDASAEPAPAGEGDDDR